MANRQNRQSRKKNGGSWKKERASVSVRGQSRPRSNKYSGGDPGRKPVAGKRSRVWVGGYTRSDGKEVKGYYRSLHQG